ncbi:MAG: hydroxychlorobactene glucosyltransferase CruC [Synechococcales cyanobacterium]
MAPEWVMGLIGDITLTKGLAGLAILSLTILVAINGRLWQTLAGSPTLSLAEPPPPIPADTLTVIIPAYNEANNIEACVGHVLASTSDPIQVVVVDDQSTDETWALLNNLATQSPDPRLRLLAGAARPEGWVGKNWACHQGSLVAETPYLLFLDCDVRLQPGSLEAILVQGMATGAGLLSVGPQVRCGCLAEWLVQPLMVAILATAYDFAAVNAPEKTNAFAFGPIMLFQRQAYEQVGGHAAVADQVVEDVALANRIKGAGLNLKQALSGSLATIRMYANGQQLWEGWTKNWYMGLGQRLDLALGVCLGILLVTVAPWWILLVALIRRDPLGVGLGGLGLVAQISIRWQLQSKAGLPMRYGWLTWLGGLVTVCIILASAYKTLTGHGWTWRGRPLTKNPLGATRYSEHS